MNKINFITSLSLVCLGFQISFSQQRIVLQLKMKSSSKVNVNVAPLKYNKHMAFSFTLDDGYRSAFTTAYPLLNGGMVSSSIPDEYHSDSGGDGQNSNGLFYTDGCGNKIPFRLAVALNAGIVYDQPDNRARLSWQEVTQLYNSGWDILNHGYHHKTEHGTNFSNEVAENIREVKTKLGFTMTQFVVPGGKHDPGYEHDYENDAFSAGAFSVASYVGKGPVIPVGQSVDLKHMIYARDLLSSNKDSLNLHTIDKQLDKMESLMQQPQPVWYNAFTHSVGNQNLWTISLLYPEFKYFMTSLYERYGEKGSDKIWMAPWQQVYEYIWLKDRVQIKVEQHGNNVKIILEVPEIPSDFRHKAISLEVKTTSTFKVIKSAINSTDNGSTKHNLINIEL